MFLDVVSDRVFSFCRASELLYWVNTEYFILSPIINPGHIYMSRRTYSSESVCFMFKMTYVSGS